MTKQRKYDPPTVDQTNPKDKFGIKKVLLGLLPAAGKIYGALAMMVGAHKYGPYNWREKKVLMSVYLDAMERHIAKFRDGEDAEVDPAAAEFGAIPHLGNIIACASILADAIEGGYIIDDRPAKGPASAVLAKYDRSKKPTS